MGHLERPQRSLHTTTYGLSCSQMISEMKSSESWDAETVRQYLRCGPSRRRDHSLSEHLRPGAPGFVRSARLSSGSAIEAVRAQLLRPISGAHRTDHGFDRPAGSKAIVERASRIIGAGVLARVINDGSANLGEVAETSSVNPHLSVPMFSMTFLLSCQEGDACRLSS